MKLNIEFTAVYNLVGLTLAAVGVLPPVLAAGCASSLPDLVDPRELRAPPEAKGRLRNAGRHQLWHSERQGTSGLREARCHTLDASEWRSNRYNALTISIALFSWLSAP